MRELYPEGVSPLTEECQYIVSVKTGTVLMAGTDATVFIHIFGEDGDTGKLFLRNSRSNVNKFEQGNTDIFYLTSANIGKVLAQIKANSTQYLKLEIDFYSVLGKIEVRDKSCLLVLRCL